MFGWKKKLIKKLRKEIIAELRNKFVYRLTEYRTEMYAKSRRKEVEIIDYFLMIANDVFDENMS